MQHLILVSVTVFSVTVVASVTVCCTVLYWPFCTAASNCPPRLVSVVLGLDVLCTASSSSGSGGHHLVLVRVQRYSSG